MKKKIKIILTIVILLLIVLIVGFIICKKNFVEYGIQKFSDRQEYEEYIENKIYTNKNKVIKLEKHTPWTGELVATISTDYETYIDISNATIYKCSFTCGCFNDSGIIEIEKLSKEKINKFLSLQNEETSNYTQFNNEDSNEDKSYWTMEYKNKETNIVSIPEELKEDF